MKLLVSVCLSVSSCTTAAACERYTFVGPVGRQYWSIAARRICSRHDTFDPYPQQHGDQQQMSCLQQCRKLNVDLFNIVFVMCRKGEIQVKCCCRRGSRTDRWWEKHSMLVLVSNWTDHNIELGFSNLSCTFIHIVCLCWKLSDVGICYLCARVYGGLYNCIVWTFADLVKKKFYVIGFEYFLEVETAVCDVEYWPAEIGIVEFSLNSGIIRSFHRVINPGK